MPTEQDGEDPFSHPLLRGVAPGARAALLSSLTRVELPAGELLFERHGSVDRVRFLSHGLVILITTLQDGRTVDGVLVGPGGALGLPSCLGSGRAIGNAVVHRPARAWVLPRKALWSSIMADRDWAQTLMHYYEAVFAAVAQLAACNGLHTLEQRLCRWLLACRTQTGGDKLPVNQDYMARLLGANRTSLAPISRDLQNSGALQVLHGTVHICDVSQIQRRACECDAVIGERFRAVMAG